MTWWQHSTTNPDDSSYETFSTDEVIASTTDLDQVIFQISGDSIEEKPIVFTDAIVINYPTSQPGNGGIGSYWELQKPYQTDYWGPDIVIFKNGDLVDTYSTNGSSETASSELITYFADKGFDITYLGTERPDIFKIGGASSNFYIEEQDNDIFSFYIDNSSDRGYQGTMRGGGGADLFEVGNIEGEFLVNGNQGEDFITGIGNIVYRGGKDNDVIAVSQGEVYGDKGADTFIGVKGDGYAVIQDYTIGEDMIEIDLDGVWDQMFGGSMFTDTSGDQILFLAGIDDIQQVETTDGGAAVGGGGGRVASNSIGDGGGWLL